MTRVLLALCGLLMAASASAQHARLFPPERLGELEGPDRDAWQRPDQIMIASRTTSSQPAASITKASVDT